MCDKIKKMKTIIISMGMHRSGTSTTTRLLEVFDFSLGDNLLPSSIENEKGYTEDIDILELNIEILNSINRDWKTIIPLDKSDFKKLLDGVFYKRAKDLIKSKIISCEKFAFKDPRNSILLPFWDAVLSDLDINILYMFTFRNPKSIVYSLEYRNNLDLYFSCLLWNFYNLECLKKLNDKNFIVIDFDSFMVNPKKQIENISNKFSLKINPLKLDDYLDKFLDKSLQHTKFSISDIRNDKELPPSTLAIYLEMIDLSLSKKIKPSTRKAIENLCNISQSQNLHLNHFEELRKSNEKFKESNEKLNESNEKLNESNEKLKESIEKLKESNADCFERVNALEKRNISDFDRIRAFEELDRKNNERIISMLNSRSWRITKPLRKIKIL